MRIPAAVRDELVDHALAETPLECCGLIAARRDERAVFRFLDAPEAAGVYRCANAASSITRYEVDGVEQMRAMQVIQSAGYEVGAIYHSHTICPPEPSEMDIASAFYPDVLYLIVGVADRDFPELRGFWIRDGQVIEEPLELA